MHLSTRCNSLVVQKFYRKLHGSVQHKQQFMFTKYLNFSVASEEPARNPHSLLTNEILETAVKQDLGPEWRLKAYEIKDFTKRGDNYSCAITGVSCDVESNGMTEKTYYVAKLNPLRQYTSMDELFNEIFFREGTFFMDVAIKLNQILKDKSIMPVNFPECVYFDHTKRQEILLSKDLISRTFRMFDRKIGMDLDHSIIVLKELAKLHASSVIFQNLKNDVISVYPFMGDKALDEESEGKNKFGNYLKYSIDNTLRLTDDIKGYQKQRSWLKDFRDRAIDAYMDQIRNAPEKMKVICHGDCWNNNILFRYNEREHPVEVAFVDLQLCRFASLGLDINYFFFSSLTGETRKTLSDQLLSAYYREFEMVMKAASIEMPFTETELREEVLDKTLFGVLTGIMIIPAVVSESGDLPDLAEVRNNKEEEYFEAYLDSLLKVVNTSPVFKPRLLSIFDDLLEKVIVSE